MVANDRVHFFSSQSKSAASQFQIPEGRDPPPPDQEGVSHGPAVATWVWVVWYFPEKGARREKLTSVH